jgi:hypothetical protein
MRLDSESQTTLNDLRWHWSDAYDVDCRAGVWVAAPKADPFAIISRDNAADLRRAIRDDYAQRAGRRSAGGCSS